LNLQEKKCQLLKGGGDCRKMLQRESQPLYLKRLVKCQLQGFSNRCSTSWEETW